MIHTITYSRNCLRVSCVFFLHKIWRKKTVTCMLQELFKKWLTSKQKIGIEEMSESENTRQHHLGSTMFQQKTKKAWLCSESDSLLNLFGQVCRVSQVAQVEGCQLLPSTQGSTVEERTHRHQGHDENGSTNGTEHCHRNESRKGIHDIILGGSVSPVSSCFEAIWKTVPHWGCFLTAFLKWYNFLSSFNLLDVQTGGGHHQNHANRDEAVSEVQHRDLQCAKITCF